MNYIFYFSGTGNTLDIAKRIGKELSNTEIINVASMTESTFRVEDSDSIGFLFPVYVFRYPLIFDKIIKQIEVLNCKYIYTIAVHGGSPYGAVKLFNKLLNKQNINVNASFELNTPDNYLVELNPPTKENAENILVETYKALELIISRIKKRLPSEVATPTSQKIMGNILAKSLQSYAKKQTDKFSVGDNCNGCSICTRVCPKNLIKLNDLNKPEWNSRDCEMCFACINLCPQKAIESGKKTVGRNRYMNPQITIKDMFVR